MRFHARMVCVAVLAAAGLPGGARAGWLFGRSNSEDGTRPAPPSRWTLADPSSLPAPGDYLDGPTGYASPPVYTSPYYYGPQTGYAFPYYHSYPASYSGARYDGSEGYPAYRAPLIQPSPGGPVAERNVYPPPRVPWTSPGYWTAPVSVPEPLPAQGGTVIIGPGSFPPPGVILGPQGQPQNAMPLPPPLMGPR